MKLMMTTLALSLAALSMSAQAMSHKEAPEMAASGASAPMSKQQDKMKMCNADAKGKAGDERAAFMKECLSKKTSSPQQNKMKSCNVEAKGKSGDERKAFMSECLSKKA